MQVIKLQRGSKISERVQSPIYKDKRISDIAYSRKRKKTGQLYGELKQSYSQFDKEAQEYIASLNVESTPDVEILKEEQEFIEASKQAKEKAKKYYEFIGQEKDLSGFDTEVEQLTTTRKLKGELKQAYSQYNKEAQEYVEALNKANTELDYDPQYNIDFEKEEVVKSIPDIEEKEYYQDVVLKEEQEFIEASKQAKEKAKSYYDFVGQETDLSVFDKEVEELTTARRAQYEERSKFLSEAETEEKGYYQGELTEYQKEFTDVLATKPTPIGKREDIYYTELNKWIEKNKEVLGKHYTKSVNILSGDIKLSEKQQTQADYLMNELSEFKTYKGGSSAYSTKVLSSSPKLAWISPAGAPQAIGIPYFEGTYQEFNPESFEIVTKESKVKRWGRLDNPITETKVISTKKLQVTDPLVREFVIQKNLPKWGYQGNFSQDAAKTQKLQIISKINKQNFNKAVIKAFSKMNTQNQFFVVNPISTPKKTVSGSFKMPHKSYKL